MPKAKNILHASKVDRIAIVDRPAVPDAEILIFKRHIEDGIEKNIKQLMEKVSEIIEKDFNSGFLFRGTEAACDALQSEVWNALYMDVENPAKVIKKAFEDFINIVINLLAKVTLNKQDAGTKLTEDDVLKPFARGLEYVALDNAFMYFKNNLAYLVTGQEHIENPEEVLKKVIESFQDFVLKSISNIVANKKAGQEPAFEKIGRVISTARLGKLKKMISDLTELVEEAESRYSDTTEKEESAMELKEILEKLEKLSADVTALSPRLSVIETAMKASGLLLTEAEATALKAKQEKEALEKRAEVVGLAKDATKEAIEKKEQEIAGQKALDIRAEAIGLPKGSKLEDVEKKEKELKDTQAASQKTAKEVIEKRAEKLGLPKDSTLEAIEKKEKETAEARLGKIEKAVSEIGKFVEVVGKRMGVKTSIDGEIVEKSEPVEGQDPFGSAVKGKK